MTPAQRRELVYRQHGSLSIVRQCALLGISHSSLYYRPKETSQQDLSLMREMDCQWRRNSGPLWLSLFRINVTWSGCHGIRC